MPKYIANAYLSHVGKIVKPGEELELNEKQAERLGEKVTVVYVEPKPPADLEDKPLTVPELKLQAEALGIEGFSNMKKDELIEAIEGAKAKQEAE